MLHLLLIPQEIQFHQHTLNHVCLLQSEAKVFPNESYLMQSFEAHLENLLEHGGSAQSPFLPPHAHDLLRRFPQVCRHIDFETGVQQQLPSLFRIGSLEPDHDG